MTSTVDKHLLHIFEGFFFLFSDFLSTTKCPIITGTSYDFYSTTFCFISIFFRCFWPSSFFRCSIFRWSSKSDISLKNGFRIITKSFLSKWLRRTILCASFRYFIGYLHDRTILENLHFMICFCERNFRKRWPCILISRSLVCTLSSTFHDRLHESRARMLTLDESSFWFFYWRYRNLLFLFFLKCFFYHCLQFELQWFFVVIARLCVVLDLSVIVILLGRRGHGKMVIYEGIRVITPSAILRENFVFWYYKIRAFVKTHTKMCLDNIEIRDFVKKEGK